MSLMLRWFAIYKRLCGCFSSHSIIVFLYFYLASRRFSRNLPPPLNQHHTLDWLRVTVEFNLVRQEARVCILALFDRFSEHHCEWSDRVLHPNGSECCTMQRRPKFLFCVLFGWVVGSAFCFGGFCVGLICVRPLCRFSFCKDRNSDCGIQTARGVGWKKGRFAFGVWFSFVVGGAVDVFGFGWLSGGLVSCVLAVCFGVSFFLFCVSRGPWGLPVADCLNLSLSARPSRKYDWGNQSLDSISMGRQREERNTLSSLSKWICRRDLKPWVRRIPVLQWFLSLQQAIFCQQKLRSQRSVNLVAWIRKTAFETFALRFIENSLPQPCLQIVYIILGNISCG